MSRKTPNDSQLPSDVSSIAAELEDLRAQYKQLEWEHQSLQEHNKNSSAFSKIAPQMLKQSSLSDLLQFVAKEIVRLTIANGAYMFALHETEEYLYLAASCGNLHQHMQSVNQGRKGLAEQAWDTGCAQYTDNYNENYAHVTLLPEDVKAVAIPLAFSGLTSGVVFITTPLDEDLYSLLPTLKETAKKTSVAAYFIAQLETQKKELQRIKDLSVLGDILYQSTDWNAILNNVSAHLFKIFDIDFVSVCQRSTDDGKIFTRSTQSNLEHENLACVSTVDRDTGHSIIDWCFANNQFAQINRHVKDPRESAEVHAYLDEKRIGSTMCIPVSVNGKPWAVFIINKHVNKKNFNESDADAFHAVASQTATALQRNNLLTAVQHQAYHDSLTELPNRRSFEHHFVECIYENSDDQCAILFLDLDGFKSINDSYGHKTGDQVLNICAKRIRKCLHKEDYLARMGGDEFAIMVKLGRSDRDINKTTSQLLKSLCQPIQEGSLRLQIGASIGVSLYPKDGKTLSELLNQADVAMYQAKNLGKGKVVYFNKKDADEIRKNYELRADLLSSLTKNQFELWYQPQVRWDNSTVTGVEALVRWNHPTGMISPYKFIPIAEESGFIDPLGMWIIEQALATLSSEFLSNKPEFRMGVNIAPPQFLDAKFSCKILSLLDKYKLNARQLKVEITESFIMHDRETVVMHLKNLRDHGVKVAIDDFGTGYSSLSYLQDLPVDVLKIDRSFVKVLNESNYEKSIAATIVTLANSLGLTTITEGVETAEQLDIVKRLGCQIIQGYYYSKPVLAEDLSKTIYRIENNKGATQKKAA